MAWVVTAPSPTQAPRTGWVTTPATTPTKPQRGWVGSGSITVMWGPRGDGTLAVTTQARPFITALLAGDGALFAALLKREYRYAALAGDSEFRADVTTVQRLAPQFNGDGGFGGNTVSTHPDAQFSGGGLLEGWSDGLHADVGIGYGIDANFSGDGNLVGSYAEIHVVFQDFAGAGTLSSALTPKLMANLAGSGQLSAAAFQLYVRTAALLASGTLSATDFAKYLRSIGFTGAGSLTNLFQVLFTPAEGGVGTISVTTMQRYFIDMTGGAAPVTVTDDFNRPDANDLGSEWTYRGGSGLGIRSGLAVALGANIWNIHSNNTPMVADDFEASIVLGPQTGGGGDYSMVGGGFNAAGEGAFLHVNASGGYYIYNQTDWFGWSMQNAGTGPAPATGDKLTIRRVGNTYYGLINNAVQVTWPDTGNLIPRDANHRLVDFGCYYDGGSVGRAVDSFSASSVGVGAGASGLNSAGTLSAVAGPPSLPQFGGGGSLSATMDSGHHYADNFNRANAANIGWIDRTGNPAYQLQIVGNAAKPIAGWAGNTTLAPIETYPQTMLFNDHRVTGIVKTPNADDVALLYVRSNNANQVVLLGYNNYFWSICTVAGAYNTIGANLVFKASSPGQQSYGDQAAIGFSAQGNTYIATLNGVEIIRWTDQAGDYDQFVDAAHHEVSIGYLCSTTNGGWDSWQADDIYVYPSLNGTTGAGALSAAANASYSRAPALSGGGALSATVAFPVTGPQGNNTGATIGAYNIAIPYWCNKIDVIALGGGGGGRGGQSFGTSVANGGGAGIWDFTTWVRGTHIPWTTTAITGSVGGGGTGGAASLGVGQPGVATTIVATGAGTRTANGGIGGGNAGDAGALNGAGAATQTFNGQTYTGSTASSGVGIAPGGGGGGGSSNLFGAGGVGSAGARGQVWLRFYQ